MKSVGPNLQLHAHFCFDVLNPNHCRSAGRRGHGIVNLLRSLGLFLRFSVKTISPMLILYWTLKVCLHSTSFVKVFLKH